LRIFACKLRPTLIRQIGPQIKDYVDEMGFEASLRHPDTANGLGRDAATSAVSKGKILTGEGQRYDNCDNYSGHPVFIDNQCYDPIFA
jgi:hypothetical protein